MNFVEAVFSFVFGDGDPNETFDERRWKELGNMIRKKCAPGGFGVRIWFSEVEYHGPGFWGRIHDEHIRHKRGSRRGNSMGAKALRRIGCSADWRKPQILAVGWVRLLRLTVHIGRVKWTSNIRETMEFRSRSDVELLATFEPPPASRKHSTVIESPL